MKLQKRIVKRTDVYRFEDKVTHKASPRVLRAAAGGTWGELAACEEYMRVVGRERTPSSKRTPRTEPLRRPGSRTLSTSLDTDNTKKDFFYR